MNAKRNAKSPMGKVLLSLAVILGFAGYAISSQGSKSTYVAAVAGGAGDSGAAPAAPAPAPAAGAGDSSVPAPSSPSPRSAPPPPQPSVPPPAPVPVTAPVHRSGYADGTYTGSVADAYYGLVQVSVTISNGAINDVSFLKYPNDRQTSIEVNSQAMPILKSEAISAQSARVDAVSGATETSGAFRESLSAALAQARG